MESRQHESHDYAQESKITEEEFDKILEENKKVGARGEDLVLNHERKWLVDNGRADLADNVTHISKESVSAGYDIVSYDLDGNKKYIEVKSSNSSNRYFYLTDNELNVARLLADRYWIYRVFDCESSNFTIVKIQNLAATLDAGKLIMSPLSYLVRDPEQEIREGGS